MLKVSTAVILALMATVIMANPTNNKINQRNSLKPRNEDNSQQLLRMAPIRLRDNRGLSCPKEGFYMDTRNCSRFYRCVDVANTGYFSIFNFECPIGQVFYEDSNSCVPGICPSQSTMPVVQGPPKDEGQNPWAPPPVNPLPVLDKPQLPWGPPPIYPDQVNTPTETFSPAPPQQTSEESSQSQSASQDLENLPPWYKETPWWFKTPPAWFHTPPAWFNAPPASSKPGIVINEDVMFGEDSQGNNKGHIIKTSPKNASLTDDKAITINIPIHIVQQ
ncbi:hypothetical protein SK128_028507 [Halocaridina rubra]|uniref:Chitin-binding type-2 domain-containing protein n=1 Tax=Halocaridina rubra TaxID=373956 RepID=A0AAN8XLT3_HALRR